MEPNNVATNANVFSVPGNVNGKIGQEKDEDVFKFKVEKGQRFVFQVSARRFGSRARFAKVNSDDEQALSARFGIRSIPTLLVFSGGKEVARQSGAMDLGALQRWLDSALG